jgi:hypothetical protein
MKNKIKSIVGNGLPWGITFFGLSFLLSQFLINIPVQQHIPIDILVGFASMLINGAMYSRFSKSLKNLQRISIDISEPELLLLEEPANHLIDERLIPGKLFLTDQRIIFKPLQEDNNALLYAWQLADLTPVHFYGSLRNEGGEFILHTMDDIPLMFEVDNLKSWKDSFRFHPDRSFAGN